MDSQDIKGLVFDCDGVLIDSERIACQVLMEMLNENGWPVGFDEVVRRFKGISAKDMVVAIEAELGKPLEPDFRKRELQRCKQRFATDLVAIPGGKLPNAWCQSLQRLFKIGLITFGSAR